MVTPGGRSSEYSTPSYDRALHALRYWLDSWSGIGHVAVGMHRQGSDPQLTQYDERGWRATFYTTGMEHSPTSATGTAWERTPWHATPAHSHALRTEGSAFAWLARVCGSRQRAASAVSETKV